MSNLIIVDVLIPGGNPDGWQTPRIFDEDTEVSELEAYIAECNKIEYASVHTKFIHGMAVEPLRQYLQDHPVI